MATRPKLAENLRPAHSPELSKFLVQDGVEEREQPPPRQLIPAVAGPAPRAAKPPPQGKVQRGANANGCIRTSLRMSVAAWEQLRIVAAQEHKTLHDLQLEGIARVFRARKLPEIS